MNLFEQLIESLGQTLGISLHAEKGFLCKIHLGKGLRVQLEYDEKKESLIMVFFLPPIPSGFFQENIFLEALKENSGDPKKGTFAYAEGKESLVLQHFLPIRISAEELASSLDVLQEKAMLWKEAIEQNMLSMVQKSTSKAPSPFTLLR